MLISIIVSVYLVYMTCCYRTTDNYSLSFQNFSQMSIPGLSHSVTNEFSNKICPLGKLATLILVCFIWIFGLEHYLVYYYTIVLFLAGLVLNLNFAIYILPVLLILIGWKALTPIITIKTA